MKITGREVTCEPDPVIKIWCECRSLEDVDDIIAWLRFAQKLMRDTEKLNAKAAYKAQAQAGKNEARRKVSSLPQLQERSGGQRSREAVEE